MAKEEKPDENWERELEALRTIVNALETLDKPAQERIIAFACSKFGIYLEGR